MNYLPSKSTNDYDDMTQQIQRIVDAHIFNSCKTCLLISDNLSRHTSQNRTHSPQSIYIDEYGHQFVLILKGGGGYLRKCNFLRINCLKTSLGAGGEGQKSFETFPKIHLFWQPWASHFTLQISPYFDFENKVPNHFQPQCDMDV